MTEVERQRADDAPTTVEVPSAMRSRPPKDLVQESSGGSEPSRVTSVATPRDALHLQEIERTRAFVKLSVGIALLTAAVLPFVGGDAIAKRAFYVGLALVVLSGAWLGWKIRTDEGYTVERALVCGAACVFAAYCGIYFFGVYSPAPVIIPFGLCFFSTGQSARATAGIYAACASLHAALSVGILLGGLADRGLVSSSALAPATQLVILALVQATYGATYLISRATRRATIHAIEQHDRALRNIAQKDALLREARQDLAAALQVGGPGQYTGETIGSFVLSNVIGRGAMGEVYEARHLTTDESAAVKLLHPHVLAQPDHVERFFREAKIVSSLEVPNVVKVRELASADSPLPYIAMERLHGSDLSDLLREKKRLSIRRVLTMLRQVGMGLDAARAAGVVHRDLKPRNLFLARSGWSEIWKILDFGVSKLTSDEGTLTRDMVVGTPTYMAPEQANGEVVTHRTDLFALGVIAYRALTGQPAFPGDLTAEILYKVVHTMPPRPGEIAPLPRQVDLVLAIAIAKRAEDRFDSAAEFAQALDAASRDKLDAALVSRAGELLARLPWGTTQVVGSRA
jgi:serine/threonine-protein kinase